MQPIFMTSIHGRAARFSNIYPFPGQQRNASVSETSFGLSRCHSQQATADCPNAYSRVTPRLGVYWSTFKGCYSIPDSVFGWTWCHYRSKSQHNYASAWVRRSHKGAA